MVRKLILLIGVLTLFSIMPVAVHASNGDQPFSVSPKFPDNQDIDVNNYISITTDKQELEQHVEFVVENLSDESIELDITPVNALTSPNGIIQYLPTLKESNSSIIDKMYGLKDYINVQDNVELSKGEKKTVSAEIFLPKVEGTVLGALQFKMKAEDEVENTKEAEFRIKNEVSNYVGVRVNFPTKSKTLDLDFNGAVVNALPSYYEIELSTTQLAPSLAKGVELDYTVEDYLGEELFKSKGSILFDFAPKTKVGVSVPWRYDKIEPNKEYTIKGTFKLADEEYSFEEAFVLEKDKSGVETGLITPPTVDNGFPWWLLLLLPLLVAIYLVYRYRNVWVLLSKENQTQELLTEEDANYGWVMHVRKIRPVKHQYPYMHLYKRSKDGEGNYSFEYYQTKRTKVDIEVEEDKTA